MWKGFDPTAYTREQFAARVDRLPRLPWCKGITLHNTAAPTLAQWVESGPQHDARLRNLQHFYEQEKGWHAGPHLFVSRDFINGFSDLTRPGVHSRCFNGSHIGIEMVGDFAREAFDTGDGAKVRDNAVFAMAVLFRKLGLEPERNLTFHKECRLDNHDCPGRLVSKTDIIRRVRQEMGRLAGVGAGPVEAPKSPGKGARFEVLATEFGGEDDPQGSFYGGQVDGNAYEVALPARLPENRRAVRVGRGAKFVVAWVNDLGPWNRNDDYWDRGERPRAEAQRRQGREADNGRVPSNEAGIDLTPAIMDVLDVPGASGTRQAQVWWEFTEEKPQTVAELPAKPPAELPTKPAKRGLAKMFAWVSGVFGTGALSVFYDWRVVALLLFAAAVLIAIFVDIRHVRGLIRQWTGEVLGEDEESK